MLRQNGASIPEICLHLLPAAARRLGSLWEEDRCGFAQVTMAVSSLHRVLHRMTAEELPPPPQGEDGGTTNNILLTCMPGEQHTFGVLVVAQFLRRAGWNVRNHFPADNEELLHYVRQKSFNIIGVSIGRYSRTRDLTLLIEALRRASINRRVSIAVGGPVLAFRPEIGGQVGADATALDAQQTVSWAQAHWQSTTAQC
jgi:methanogenic corrinoid protein MtbC1